MSSDVLNSLIKSRGRSANVRDRYASGSTSLKRYLAPKWKDGGPPNRLWIAMITNPTDIINPNRTTIASHNLARLIRPSKRNRYQVQSMPKAPDGGRMPSIRYVSRAGQSPVRLVPQQLVDAGFGAGALVDALHDHGAGGGRAGLAVLQGLAGQRAGNHDRIVRNFADENFAGLAVDDLGGGAEEHAHRQHGALAHDHAFRHLAARADEAVVLDDHGLGLQRLQHAADADATRNMHALADLRAASDGGPGVDHGRFIDIGAEIDERRHQHNVAGDEGGAAHDRAGDGAESCIAKTVLAPALELRGHLVPPRRLARAAGNRAHVVEAERQQHRLLQPLVDLPLAIGAALGDAGLAFVQQLQRVIDGLANFTLGRRRDAVAGIECGVDGGFQRGQGHRDFLKDNRSDCDANWEAFSGFGEAESRLPR